MSTIRFDAPVARTPLQRYREAVRKDERAWRPNTQSHGMRGAVIETRLPPTEKWIVAAASIAARRPQGLPEIAETAQIGLPAATAALAHLEMHGWAVRSGDSWSLLAGLDCDCSKLPRKPTAEQIAAIGLKTALYRLFNAVGEVIYIGISDALRTRMRRHAEQQPWWPEVASKTVAWYDTRAEADAAETLAIAAEKPKYNKAKLYAPRAAEPFDF